jgi:hypothetical protein
MRSAVYAAGFRKSRRGNFKMLPCHFEVNHSKYRLSRFEPCAAEVKHLLLERQAAAVNCGSPQIISQFFHNQCWKSF